MNTLNSTALTLEDILARGGKKDPEVSKLRSLFKTFYYLSLNVGSPKRLLAVLNKDFQSCSMAIAEACAVSFKETFPGVVKWQRDLHKKCARISIDIPIKLKNGRKYNQKYAQIRTPDGRLFHLPMYEKENYYTGQKEFQPKINDCTSVSLISPEALLQKQSMIEIQDIVIAGKYSPANKFIGFCHDEVVLELSDDDLGREFAREVYGIVAKNFQKELGGIPSGMVVTDDAIESTLADNYSEK